MRQVVLDTETTGIDPKLGHRIIEIGCVELINRRITGRHFHQYINPMREVDQGAMEVHGITNEFLADKPLFSDIVDSFIEYIGDAELVIHNAPFDVGFLDHEFKLIGPHLGTIADRCSVLDTLVLARNKHPGQKNNLDALCRRYSVDNSQRDLHGALLDAEILADVYLLMTGGQKALALGSQGAGEEGGLNAEPIERITRPEGAMFKVIKATEDELVRHQAKLEVVDKASGGNCHWLKGAQ